MGSTVYDAIIGVANEMGYPVTPERLVPTTSLGGALIGDIAQLVTAEADRRYPQQKGTYCKVPAVRGGRFTVPARLYPHWMFSGFIGDIIRRFIEEKHPFSTTGEVIYERPIVGKAGKRQKTIEYRLQKFGSCTLTERISTTGAGGAPISVVRTTTYTAAPPVESAPASSSVAQFPPLRPQRGGRR
jgi:hypothetical protein